ncbi:helix-turn-helix transcriptional regulator [Streptomyces sp. TRM70308]|uniref:helix-turn-helix domain-containing protein n=1 Tax=Streptomyces sp. TRM70308 TaxID=3131932 RepID=UPI003D0956CE
MGRPEAPIDYTIRELGVIAEILRAMRHSAGLSYRDMALRAHYSPAHLKRAASGKRTSFDVIAAYGRACMEAAPDCCADHRFPDMLRVQFFQVAALHELALARIREAARTARVSKVVPKPQYVRDVADLSGALRDIWGRAARPTSRQIEDLSRGQVPRSTAHAITAGRTVPKDLRQYIAFLTACEVSAAALTPWLWAWIKVRGVPTGTQRLIRVWMEPEVATAYLSAVLDHILAARPAKTEEEQEALHSLAVEAKKELRQIHDGINRLRRSSRGSGKALLLPHARIRLQTGPERVVSAYWPWPAGKVPVRRAA